MNRTRKWLLAGAGVGVAALALAVAAVSPRLALAHGGMGGGMGMAAPADLAKALGITTDELQAAEVKAQAAALDDAVTKGLITKEQAQTLKDKSAGITGTAGKGGFLGRMGHWGMGRFGTQADHETNLAKALNISVDKLQAAEKTAFEAGLKAAQDAGRITAAQADTMRAGQALGAYLQKQGLGDKMRTEVDQAIKDAVKAGVITQAQADELQKSGGMGMGCGGGMGMHFGGRGFGGAGFRGRGFPAPSPDTTSGSGTGTFFRRGSSFARPGSSL